ncbi:MAG: hypothetical protein M0009_13675 [Deltaproteobacteria bacterium]|nr:hypothetical protein [Deltaproteobacteria bacterium]
MAFAAWPAPAVVLMTIVISGLFSGLTFAGGMESVWKILLRFLRFSFILAIPITLLPAVCGIMQSLLNRRKLRLVRISEERHPGGVPWQIWLIRPFQGIGLAMLIATKLIALLQLSTYGTINSSVVLPPAQFQLGRFLSATVVAVMTSILLTFLWTLADLGVRRHNRKTGEIKIIGKYLSALLPILFGFYGMFSLFGNHERLLAIQYIAQMVLALYPPFLVLAVVHKFYTERKAPLILKRLKAVPVVPLQEQELAIV